MAAQSLCRTIQQRDLRVNAFGRSLDLNLRFEPYQSVLLRVDCRGAVAPVDIHCEVPASRGRIRSRPGCGLVVDVRPADFRGQRCR